MKHLISHVRVLPRATAVLTLALALALGACGGGSGNGAVATAVGGVAVIDQDALAFKPSAATIKAGERILFKNSETALHTVTIEGENVSGAMRRGESFEFMPASPGVYKITCDYHPQMRATLTVE